MGWKSHGTISSISLMSMFRIKLDVIENLTPLSLAMNRGLCRQRLAPLGYRFVMTCGSLNFSPV
jgi:hypothetical protein